jgi:hypothetical protein
MRKPSVTLALSFVCVLALGCVIRCQAQSSRPDIHRDIKLEGVISVRYQRIAKVLQPEAKRKLVVASRALIRELVKTPEPDNPYSLANAQVNKQFGGLASAQSELLTFYLLADVLRYAQARKDKDSIKQDIDNMSEMSEMESLRLQMMMDRMSKMMTTLSNLLKKISDTSDGIVGNLK